MINVIERLLKPVYIAEQRREFRFLALKANLNDMKFFEASVGTIVGRFYLMMAVIIVAGFIDQWWIAIFAFPIMISAIAGISFKSGKASASERKYIKERQLNEAA